VILLAQMARRFHATDPPKDNRSRRGRDALFTSSGAKRSGFRGRALRFMVLGLEVGVYGLGLRVEG